MSDSDKERSVDVLFESSDSDGISGGRRNKRRRQRRSKKTSKPEEVLKIFDPNEMLAVASKKPRPSVMFSSDEITDLVKESLSHKESDEVVAVATEYAKTAQMNAGQSEEAAKFVEVINDLTKDSVIAGIANHNGIRIVPTNAPMNQPDWLKTGGFFEILSSATMVDGPIGPSELVVASQFDREDCRLMFLSKDSDHFTNRFFTRKVNDEKVKTARMDGLIIKRSIVRVPEMNPTTRELTSRKTLRYEEFDSLLRSPNRKQPKGGSGGKGSTPHVFSALSRNTMQFCLINGMYCVKGFDEEGILFYVVGTKDKTYNEVYLPINAPCEDFQAYNTAMMDAAMNLQDVKQLEDMMETMVKLDVKLLTQSNFKLLNEYAQHYHRAQTVDIYFIAFWDVLSPILSLERSHYGLFPTCLSCRDSPDVLCTMNLQVLQKKGGVLEENSWDLVVNPTGLKFPMKLPSLKTMLNNHCRMRGDAEKKPKVGNLLSFKGQSYVIDSKKEYLREHMFAGTNPSQNFLDNVDQGVADMQTAERDGKRLLVGDKLAIIVQHKAQQKLFEEHKIYRIGCATEVSFLTMIWKEEHLSTAFYRQCGYENLLNSKNNTPCFLHSNWAENLFRVEPGQTYPTVFRFVSELSILMLQSETKVSFYDLVTMIENAIENRYDAFFKHDLTKEDTGRYTLLWFLFWVVCVTVWTVDHLFSENDTTISKDIIAITDYDRKQNWCQLPYTVVSESAELPTRFQKLCDQQKKPIDFHPGTVLYILTICEKTHVPNQKKLRSDIEIQDEIKKSDASYMFHAAFQVANHFRENSGRAVRMPVKEDEFKHKIPEGLRKWTPELFLPELKYGYTFIDIRQIESGFQHPSLTNVVRPGDSGGVDGAAEGAIEADGQRNPEERPILEVGSAAHQGAEIDPRGGPPLPPPGSDPVGADPAPRDTGQGGS